MIPESMIPILIDVAIVLLLAFFAWRGACKGLILTLFGLLAVVVAWIGASMVSSLFAQPVANIIRPSIENAVSGVIEEKLPELLSGIDLIQDVPGSEGAGAPGAEMAEQVLERVSAALDELEVFSGIKEYLRKMVSDNAAEVIAHPVELISTQLSLIIASAGLFVISYLLILLVWFLISHAMDLAFQLPILKEVNMAGGGVIGFAKGLIVVLVCVWFLKLGGILTESNIGPVAGLMSLEGLDNALNRVVMGG